MSDTPDAVEIFRRHLHLTADRERCLDTPFAELGVDSLDLVDFSMVLETEAGLHVDLDALDETSTLRTLLATARGA